ncbi:DUF6624 domain-containing protein [Streptomyces mayteni]
MSGTADGPEAVASLAAELLRRRDEDQHVRGLLPDAGPWPADLVDRMHAIDADNTGFLRQVIERHGWPRSSLVGRDAGDAAWLLALLYSLHRCRVLGSDGGLEWVHRRVGWLSSTT